VPRSCHSRPRLREFGRDLDVAADGSEAVVHVLESDAVVGGCGVEAWSVVAYVEVDVVCLGVEPDRDVRIGSGVFEGVLDGFGAAVADRGFDFWREPVGARVENGDSFGVACGE
jgi:hypothetical protein